MTHFDAIVSGCGPSGGVLANLLAAQGLSVCVIEKFAQVYPLPRAIVLDWEVMRALQYCGVAHALAPATRPHPGTDFVGVDGGVIKLFDPAPPPYPLGWPATSTFIQPELEKMLRRALKLRDRVEMKLGYTLTGFEQDAAGVRVTITEGETDRVEQISGDYLIGCDGANSVIRRGLGFGLEDYQFDQWWVVVDAWQLTDTDLPAKTTQYCWPSRPATYVVGPGNLRRWEIKMLPGEEPRDFDNPAKLREVMRSYVDVRAFEVWRSASYRFAARVGDRWRDGRVFLAGDAVHQTPPFLGQGLCAGVRDAFNLAWKIGLAKRLGLSQAAADGLFSSYEQERKPHVAKIIEHAKDFGLIIGEMDADKALARDARLRAELVSGQMTTTRQAFIPPLRDGILGDGALAGSLMVQPRVERGAGAALLDDLVPMAFQYITLDAEAEGWMTPHRALWERIGGSRISFAQTGAADVVPFTEAGSTLQDWAAENGARAVIVRPDRYVYGLVTGPGDLATALDRLAGQIGIAM